MSTEPLPILLIDDDEDDYRLTADLLREVEQTRYDLHWQPSYAKGLEAVCDGRFAACLVDYRLGAKNGVDLIREATAGGCVTPMVLITGYNSRDVDLRAMGTGAVEYLSKAEIHGNAALLERTIRYAIERRRAQEEKEHLQIEFQNAQRLQALATMASGIARDFETQLDAIRAHLATVKAKLPPYSPVNEELQRIEATSQRAAALCRQLLAYAGESRVVVEAIDLSMLVIGLASLTENPSSRRLTFTYDLGDALPPVLGDPAQIRQVVMNLVTNSREAIGDADGTITIATRVAEVAPGEPSAFGLEVTPGTYICLEISDTGCGMDATTQERLFEPFFTTRQHGRGLGLSAVLGIVRRHHGGIRVRSVPGNGAALQVLLPAVPR